MGAALGGGNSTSAFGATGATSLFGKLTYIAAVIFMVSSVWLTVIKSSGGDIGLSDKLKQKVEEKAPAKKEKLIEGGGGEIGRHASLRG